MKTKIYQKIKILVMALEILPRHHLAATMIARVTMLMVILQTQTTTRVLMFKKAEKLLKIKIRECSFLVTAL